MGATRVSFSCVLIAVIAISFAYGDLLDTLGAQGPERMDKRSLPNHFDCPPSMRPSPIGPQPPAPVYDCPPGTVPVQQQHPGQLPHGIPPAPCAPWVDDQGDCHIADVTHDGDRCRAFYGEETYKRWRSNYLRSLHSPQKRLSPPGQLPGEPICRPAYDGGYQ